MAYVVLRHIYATPALTPSASSARAFSNFFFASSTSRSSPLAFLASFSTIFSCNCNHFLHLPQLLPTTSVHRLLSSQLIHIYLFCMFQQSIFTYLSITHTHTTFAHIILFRSIRQHSKIRSPNSPFFFAFLVTSIRPYRVRYVYTLLFGRLLFASLPYRARRSSRPVAVG